MCAALILQLFQAQMDDSFHGKGCGMRKGKSESFSTINDHNKQEQHTSDRGCVPYNAQKRHEREYFMVYNNIMFFM